MRKKAEQAIRRASASLGTENLYRIDRVRKRAGILPKVFDKTVLDMARLGTIALLGGDTEGLAAGDLIRRGETTYVYFSFLESEAAVEGTPDPSVEISLPGLQTSAWQRFDSLCRIREGTSGVYKIIEYIHEYNQALD